jgi:hypothetical protein
LSSSVQEKRILEPHFTHCGSLSRPLVWFSGIVCTAWLAAGTLRATVPQLESYGNQPEFALHTLKVFRTALA